MGGMNSRWESTSDSDPQEIIQTLETNRELCGVREQHQDPSFILRLRL